ncbi:valyl-tRNA synthetase [Thermoanaerobacter italicus Ab9]|uniref:Valine--tRNA ligase n=1 Tax=Thermoanaerobacter italicus (strain DSM 9252 / Ab9) TaxID=580331 RepID=D3T7U2_THEIA|nr:valine--tRNA ligase [Thermoanaerobacter italicus]ADD02024.1 valyl-tRNA synthetase [Thermoanaerobacter italicus Ab9]
MKEIAKTYNPKEFEDRIYAFWMEKGYFTPKIDSEKQPFTIVIPPPNITGQLHMGHALDNTLQDILIRWKRMQGYSALWIPGSDHASIATEVKVLDTIREETGLTKKEIGREEFLKRAWAWKDKYENRILSQLKKLGSSCDWTRTRFTMDEVCSRAVREVFVSLYEKGLIYRGDRIINWCPDCNTALSDAEVEHKEHKGHLWYIKYPIKGEDGYVVIATTRPETMLGDVAVAVNPDDERYKDVVGKTLILPLVGREIPVIADSYVDPSFGTGAVKVTPAHDPNDFEMGIRHNLEFINIMNENATINENGGKYKGLDRYEARERIVEDLKNLGLLLKVEDHVHNVGHCYRCDTVVEPLLSKQWFVKMEPLAKPALEVVKEGKIKFVPERFEKIYTNWLENIKDWCISRQLWWGHRIPAWYCDDCGHITVSRKDPQKCEACGSTNIHQDEDVLDTWFSSALWPFSTMGWPEETQDLKYFYPTDVLVTGYDIIFFWVARMIFMSLEFMKEVPFKHVLIHGLVRDAQGRKMSKSLGNGIDPLEVIEEYGADTLRFTLVIGNAPGNDMRFSQDKVELSRNFANKLWNASRYVLLNLTDNDTNLYTDGLTIADKWILTRYNSIVKEVTENLEKFELGIAATKLYDFVWSEFCDWYIELSKPVLYSDNLEAKKVTKSVLRYVLDNTLRLLHPFMPFITEEIWQNLPHEGESIMAAEWPKYKEELDFTEEAKNAEIIMEAIRTIRNLRAEANVSPSKKAKVIVAVENENYVKVFEVGTNYIMKLAGASEVVIETDKSKIPHKALSGAIEGGLVVLPLEDLIDLEEEIKRLNEERQKVISEIERAQGLLNNENFVKKAPEKVVNAEREKLEKYTTMLKNIEERLKLLKS